MKPVVVCILLLVVGKVYSCTPENCQTCVRRDSSTCSKCNSGFYWYYGPDCLACPQNCDTCSRTSSSGEETTTPTCLTCKAGSQLESGKCTDATGKGNLIVVAATVPFGIAILVFVLISYCLQAKMESVPESVAAMLRGTMTPTTAASNSTLMPMTGPPNTSFGGYQGAVVA